MKLPFDLGIKLVLRLLLPGFLLTLGLYPLLATLTASAGWEMSAEYLVVLSSIVTGWVVVQLDMPIYMLFEGRRFWPGPLRRLFVSRENQRLLDLLNAEEESFRLMGGSGPAAVEAKQRNAEAWVDLRQFPLDADGNPYAAYPTRLGNLVTAYESYADTRYGVDTIFWWPRIWLMLDKDTREELDTRQASADSGLYAAGALIIDALLWAAYLALRLLGPVLTASPYLGTGTAKLLKGLNAHLAGSWAVAAAVLGFALASWLAYRVALHPQAQYGETFKAVFDLNEQKVDVATVVDRVVAASGDFGLRGAGRRAQLKAAWRYLHNYRARCPDPRCADAGSVPVPLLEKHRDAHAAPGSVLPAASADTIAGTVALNAVRRRIDSLRDATVVACAALLLAAHWLSPLLYLAAPLAALALWIAAWNLRRRSFAAASALQSTELRDRVRQVEWVADFLVPWLPELMFFLAFLAIGLLLYIIER